MRLIAHTILAIALLGLIATAGKAEPSADRMAALRRGVNLTNWFRFPARADDEALRWYLSDTAIAQLRRAGFTFVRLAVQPDLLEAAPRRLPLLVEAIARLQRQGLAVVLAPHPIGWHLEDSGADRARLLDFWRHTATALHRLDSRLIFPETLNEPVFADAPQAWESLQEAVLTQIRGILPDATVVLTGANWGGIDGLTALHPTTDRNVIYSFHFYEPSELTALAAYRPGLDRAALARLPFPMNAEGCRHAEQTSRDADTRNLMAFVCGMGWDSAQVSARIARAADWVRAITPPCCWANSVRPVSSTRTRVLRG